jgi:plastocyanin
MHLLRYLAATAFFLITIRAMYRIRSCTLLPRTGRVAFSVIIAVAALTGVLSFMIFSRVSPGPLLTPAELFQPAPYTGPPMGELKEGGGSTATAGAEGQGAKAAGQNQSAAIPPNAVTISIPQGASVQGNPSYNPETAQAGIGQTVAWKNDDTVPHTATSGTLFDSSIISPGGSYSIAAEKIGTGEHDYSCTVHPYMKGKVVIK